MRNPGLIFLVIVCAFALVGIIAFCLGMWAALNQIEVEEMAYHDCEDYLEFEEGHPDYAFKCTKCKKRY